MVVTVGFITAMIGVTAIAVPGQPPQAETPFACNLGALSATERRQHQDLTVRLSEAVLGKRELPDGFAFEVDTHRLSIHDLATWTTFERRCCPFFDFSIELRREGGPTSLGLTGREGVKEFIHLEFAKLFR